MAAPLLESVTLENGKTMPIFGLGTSHSGGYSHSTVVYALKDCGYRMIDTAKRYGCEENINLAIKESGIPREDIFITSKLWAADHGYFSTKEAFYGSCKRLGVSYLDLFLIHWPEVPSWCTDPKNLRLETWRALEELLDKGVCHSIGVSNYLECHLQEIIDNGSVVPHVNQFEFHPYYNKKQLHNFCKENKIQFEGYCPLAKGYILNESPIVRVSQQCNKTPAQVLIRWSIQNKVVTIPKSIKEYRVLENSQVFDFELSEQQMLLLDNLHDNRRMVNSKNIQAKIDEIQPDGYKLTLSNMNNHFTD